MIGSLRWRWLWLLLCCSRLARAALKPAAVNRVAPRQTETEGRLGTLQPAPWVCSQANGPPHPPASALPLPHSHTGASNFPARHAQRAVGPYLSPRGLFFLLPFLLAFLFSTSPTRCWLRSCEESMYSPRALGQWWIRETFYVLSPWVLADNSGANARALCAGTQTAPPPHPWTQHGPLKSRAGIFYYYWFQLRERERVCVWSICWNWLFQWLAGLDLNLYYKKAVR